MIARTTPTIRASNKANIGNRSQNFLQGHFIRVSPQLQGDKPVAPLYSFAGAKPRQQASFLCAGERVDCGSARQYNPHGVNRANTERIPTGPSRAI